MAVTAKFQADFSSFLNAIDKAEIALVDFGQGANTVETKLNRMVDNFSGRKLIQEATLMTTAVEKAGGVATLTATQLEQVGAKANDAADKLKKLGVEVPADLQKLADETKNANTHFKTMEDVAGELGKALGGLVAVERITEFEKGIFEAADSLTKLSDKTGIGVETLQKFQIVGEDAGNTLDEITSAITKMENKLVGGDAKALDALGKLGLTFEDIKGLTPENQFIAISDAIRQIDDPAKQVNIAMALFGKAGAEILPTLKKGFDDVKDGAVGMSKETVKAFDDAGDAIKKTWIITKGYTAEALVFLGRLVADGLDPNVIAAKNLERQAEATALQLGEMAKQARALLPPMQMLAPDDVHQKLALFEFDLNKSNEALTKIRQEAEKAADAQAKYRDEVLKTTPADKNQVIALEGLLNGLVAGTDAYNRVRDAIGGMLEKGLVVPDMLKRWYEANQPVLKVSQDFSGVMATMPNVLSDTADSLHNLASTANEFHDGISVAGNEVATVTIPLFTTLTKGVLPQMSKEIQQAGTDIDQSFGDRASGVLGGMVKILHQVHDTFAEVAATAAQGAKTMIDSWKNTHSVVDLVINAVTTGISLISKLFSDAEKQVNPVRQAFVDLHGGLAALNEEAAAAGTTLTAMLNAKNPEQYKKAIDDLNAALDFQTGAMKTLDDTVAKYGFTISELGPTFAKQKLDEQAGQLLQDYQVLTAAGVDHVAILDKMGPALNEYVKQAILSGQTIPSSMKPVLQSMVDLGELTDENGDKLDDLSRLTFADTLDKKFSTLIDTINKLTDAISRGLGTAIANLPTRKQIDIVTVYSDIDNTTRGGGDTAYASRGGIVTPGGVQYLAGGGRVLPWPSRGSDTVPAMLTPGEGVVSRRGMASLGRAGLAAINRGGGMGGSGVMVVNNFSIAADVDSPAARERVRKVVDQATMAALRRQKRTNVA